MKLADALVDALIALDVRYVFGVSGANIEHLHDAIHRRGAGKLVSVLARSETGAAFMADARARVHRTLGVCCCTSGGAMMNLAVGIAESHSESVPVLAIVGQPPENVAGRGAFQDSSGIGRTVAAAKLFDSVAKFVAKVMRPEQFWPAFTEAVVAALSGRQGPAALMVPRNLFDADVPPLDPAVLEQIRAQTAPAAVDLDEAREFLSEIRAARHPVLILGHGVRRCSRPSAVIDFARAVRLPVITTMSARGEFDNDDPLYLGVLGVAGHPSVHEYLRSTADLLVVVGAGLNTMTRAPFAKDPVDLPQKRIVAVNIDPTQLQRVIEPSADDPGHDRSFWPETAQSLACVLEADAGVAFETLLSLWRQRPFEVPALGRYQRTYFEPTLAPPIAPEKAERESLLQSDAIAILQSYLPETGHIVYDAGNCAATALHVLDIPRGVTATIALGMGGMGYAVAGAIGAQLGSPAGARTVVVTGDGSFLMTGFEVHTAVDLGLSILFVVFNNNMHGMCVTRQQIFFGSRLECVRYAPVDIAQVARGLGSPETLWVGRALSAADMYVALEEYLSLTPARTGLLEVYLEREELPPFVPFLPRAAATVESIVPSIPPPPSSRLGGPSSQRGPVSVRFVAPPPKKTPGGEDPD